MILYHVTAAEKLESIRRDGLRDMTYLVGEDESAVVKYYKETVRDEGLTPVVLRIDADRLQMEGAGSASALCALEPDHPGLEEPLTVVLDRHEEEIARLWGESSQDWAASLDIVGTCRFRGTIAPDLIVFPGATPAP